MQYQPQGDIGMLAVEDAVMNDLHWIFRRQHGADMGIDAHIEIVVRGEATGRLIGVQVKSGSSFFREADGDRIVFRSDERHADYWRSHSLPVIVALHDPASGTVYWQRLDDSTIVSTGVGRRVDVPRSQVLGRSAAGALIDLTTEIPYDQKMAALAVARPYMEMLRDGKTLVVEVDEWVNKSSGRGDFRIKAVDDDPEELLESFIAFGGSRDYADFIRGMFPWADVEADEEFYDAHGDDERFEWWEPEHVGAFVNEHPIRPYGNVADEADQYRLTLTLNELGRGFLAVDDYLNS